MTRKKSHEEFIVEVQSLVGDEYIFLERYSGTQTPILCKHITCGHEWRISPGNFLYGKRCPKCSRARKRYKYTLEDAKRLFLEKGLILLAEKYEGITVNMPFLCSQHKDKGVQYKTLSSVIQSTDKGCKFCGYERSSKKQIDPSRYSEMQQCFLEHGLELLDSEYKGVNMWYKCQCLKNPEHGIFYKKYDDIKSQNQGCPHCGYENLRKSRRKDKSHYKKIVEDSGYIFVDVEYHHRDDGGTQILYICPHHKERGIQTKSVSKIKSLGCPYCSESKGEHYIRQYLNSCNIKYEVQKTFVNLYGVGSAHLSYDFYLPDYCLLIEFQGIQHENAIDFFGGEHQFKIQQEHDKRKREYAERYGYKLLEIWYYDIENITQILDEHLSVCEEVC